MKIGFLGYGRMGQAIEKLALESEHDIILRIDKENQEERTPSNLSSCDVILEFSQPEIAYSNIEACLDAGVPVVSGTTGWLDQLPEILAFCAEKNGALFYASNFSIGVNLFFELNKQLARLIKDLPQYQPSLTEIHHIHKLDAPSGTAISLAQDLIREMPNLEDWTMEEGDPEQKLPIRSIREGEVPGTHAITYDSPVDSIQLIHTAHSREGFASGALSAAEWIIGKQGFFEMADLLGWR